MGSKNVTLHIDEDLYNKYKAFCKENGYLVSGQLEILMKKQMEANNSWKLQSTP